MYVVLFLSQWMPAEMNGFMFFKSKSDPTILFQNPVQIEDDCNASKNSAKAESLLVTKKQSCNDRSSMSIVVINISNKMIMTHLAHQHI